MGMDYDLAQLANVCSGRAEGDRSKKIDSIAPLDTAGPDQISYLSNSNKKHFLATTKAGIVLLREDMLSLHQGNSIIVKNPQLAFALVSRLVNPLPDFTPAIHSTALLAADAEVSPLAWIGPNVIIEAGAEVGDHTRIESGSFLGKSACIGSGVILNANVTVHEKCRIGDDCVLQSGAVIGSDGFGYVVDPNHQWIQMPQQGAVVIGDRVDIGANTTIDRGTLGDTVIHDGVKIDNLVQIAHNVVVGENSAIAACVGIAGSTIIGMRCSIGGQVGIHGHLEIGSDVTIAATSLVTKSISGPGVYSSGLRVTDVNSWQKNAARIYQLDDMARRLRRLEKKLKKLS